MGKTTCSVTGCERPATRRGWCAKHYSRWMRHGDPLVSKSLRGAGIEERFLANLNKDGPPAKHNPELGPCWVKGVGKSYAKLWIDGVSVPAYRWAYEHWVGPIPEDLQLDHFACDNGEGGCGRAPWAERITESTGVTAWTLVAIGAAAHGKVQ